MYDMYVQRSTGRSENRRARCHYELPLSVCRRSNLLHLAVFTLVLFAAACTNRELTRTPRTGTEQLLLGHAIQRSVNNLTLPFPPLRRSPSKSSAFRVIGSGYNHLFLETGQC